MAAENIYVIAEYIGFSRQVLLLKDDADMLMENEEMIGLPSISFHNPDNGTLIKQNHRALSACSEQEKNALELLCIDRIFISEEQHQLIEMKIDLRLWLEHALKTGLLYSHPERRLAPLGGEREKEFKKMLSELECWTPKQVLSAYQAAHYNGWHRT